MEQIGKYRVLSQLGAGGFGAVYLAEDNLGQQVAIKVFRLAPDVYASVSSTGDDQAENSLRQRFIDEARTLRKLSSSPYIVDMYDFDELDDKTPYYVMPYLTSNLVDQVGKDVQDAWVIAELPPEQRPRALPLARAHLILKQLLSALQSVHSADLVHRDIKPANILFDGNGNVQLADFGIAKMPDSEQSHTASGVAMGSRHYMAPEQRESARHCDARADIYAVGVLAYRIYTGTLPVGRFDDPMKLCPAMGEDLNDLILRCLSQRREDRPDNAADMNQEFVLMVDALNGVTSTAADDDATVMSGGPREAPPPAVDDDDDSKKTVPLAPPPSVGPQWGPEVRPLQERIVSLLLEHGEIPEAERDPLKALSEIVGLDSNQLEQLIVFVADENSADITPIRNYLNAIDRRLEAQNGKLDKATRNVLRQAGEHIGWDQNRIDRVLGERQKLVRRSLADARTKTGNTAFAGSFSHSNSQSSTGVPPVGGTDLGPIIKAIAALLLLALLGGGGWFGYSQYSANLAEQQALELKAWEDASTTATAEAYERFLSAWPEGANSSSAQSALKAIKDQQKMVRDVQDMLARLEYRVSVTGREDRLTAAALREAAKASGRETDGKVKPDTKEWLQKIFDAKDLAHWNAAREANTVDSYNAYFEVMPEGKYLVEAKSGIEALERKVKKAEGDAQRKEESARIAEVQKVIKSMGYMIAISGSLDGRTQKILDEISVMEGLPAISFADNKLKTALLNVARLRDQKAWEQTLKTNDENAFRQYLADWPQGDHRSKAESALKRIAAENREKVLAAQRERDRLLASQKAELAKKQRAERDLERRWKSVQSLVSDLGQPVRSTGKPDSATVKALAKLRGAYKIPSDVDDVRGIERALRSALSSKDDDAWRSAAADGSVNAMKSYLSAWPRGRHTDDARQKIAKIEDAARAKAAAAQAAARTSAGKVLKDCANCPELVILPKGNFILGGGDAGTVQISIARDLAIGRHEVTRAEFEHFVSATGHKTWAEGADCDPAAAVFGSSGNPKNWRNPGYSQSPRDPVVCTNWNDANRYAQWLSAVTGARYRLPSEAEWEYAARAGSTGNWFWGNSLSGGNARCEDCGDKESQTAPVGSYPANAFGVFDMHGNVWEWTQDCWSPNYNGIPSDGSPRRSGDCSMHVSRGGAFSSDARSMAVHFRLEAGAISTNTNMGFRVLKEL